MALVGRLLEAQGFRVGIIAQPDWRSVEAFRALGRPTVMWGVTAGNMDSMVNRYTSDRRLRHDDAYSPGGTGGRRPDRALVVYAQGCREAYGDVPVVMGGIEGSLRRIAHYDYWSDKVRRSILIDSRADLLVYGNGERADRRDRAPARGGRGGRQHHRPARDGVHATCRAARRLDRDRLDDDRPARSAGAARRSVRGVRADGDWRTPPARRRRLRRSRIRAARQPATARRPHPTRSCACPTSTRSRPIRCCTRTPRASCTWRRTRGTRGRWSSGTARVTSG